MFDGGELGGSGGSGDRGDVSGGDGSGGDGSGGGGGGGGGGRGIEVDVDVFGLLGGEEGTGCDICAMVCQK